MRAPAPQPNPSGPITKLPNGGALQALYAHVIPNAPGMKLVGVKVDYEPGGFTVRHRHGNAFVSTVVLSGSVTSGLNDEDPKTYGEADGWTENPGDIHSVSRNASDTESASFIAHFVCPIEQEEYVM